MQYRWTFSPDENHFDDLADAPAESTRISLRPTDRNSGRLAELPLLEEITAREPSAEQVEVITDLPALKRLRVGHTRFTDFSRFSRLHALEQLVLIWVRGVPDFSALHGLAHLRSLFLANIIDLTDFSSLAGLNALTTLEIDGKLGKPQKLDDLEFLASLRGLRNLRLGDFTCRAKPPVFAPLLHLTGLQELEVTPGAVSPEDWAFLEARFPFLEGRGDPLIFVQPAGKHEWIEGVHDSVAVENLPEGNYVVTFGLKGFRAFWGLKPEALAKIRRFETRMMRARSEVAAG